MAVSGMTTPPDCPGLRSASSIPRGTTPCGPARMRPTDLLSRRHAVRTACRPVPGWRVQPNPDPVGETFAWAHLHVGGPSRVVLTLSPRACAGSCDCH